MATGGNNTRSALQTTNESEEISLETTVPTDFTLSPESDEGKESKLTLKQQLERKQLLHDLQLLKIELSHKSLIIDNMKAEHMAKVDDLEEKVADIQHQKQVIQVRLESQLKMQQEEAKRRISQTKQEMEAILAKQEYLEGMNARLQERAGDVKRSLRQLELNEEQYVELKETSPDELSLKDYITMRIYEICWPLKEENSELRERENRIKKSLLTLHQDCVTAKDELEVEKRFNSEHKFKMERMASELDDLRMLTKDIDYKRDNFDKVKRERDCLQEELKTLKKTWVNVKSTHDNTEKERNELVSEVKSLRQQVPLLTKDKEYFAKQVIDLSSKLSNAEERLSLVSAQLDRCQESRENIYDRFISSKYNENGKHLQQESTASSIITNI